MEKTYYQKKYLMKKINKQKKARKKNEKQMPTQVIHD